MHTRLPAFVLLVGFGLAVPGLPVSAQVAVPYYGPEAFVAAFEAHGQAPQAAQFAATAGALVDAVEFWCAPPEGARPRPQPTTAKSAATASASGARGATAATPGDELRFARDAWLVAADAWERLDAVAVGATIERRAARSLDFRPTRPRLIEAAIAVHGKGRQPPDAKALERVGTPAKGLPALEWLLWDSSAPRSAGACRYAIGLAQAVHVEAAELAAGHAADAARDWQEESEAAADRAGEIINQWLAGIEALRWRQLGKPLSIVASQRDSRTDSNRYIWPRPASASHREVWQARWESLRKLAIGPAPTDGFGPQPAVAPALISIEALLRGRGRNDAADAWVKRVMAADDAVQALTARAREDGRVVDQGFQPGPQAPLPAPAAASSGSEAVPLPPVATMTKALQTLDAVKAYMQETVAPALEIALGFSDADGD